MTCTASEVSDFFLSIQRTWIFFCQLLLKCVQSLISVWVKKHLSAMGNEQSNGADVAKVELQNLMNIIMTFIIVDFWGG